MSKGPGRTRKNRGSFDQRLEEARRRAGLDDDDDDGEDSHRTEGNTLSLAMQLGAEMVAALAVAIAIGYGLDRLLHTSPWFMIGFIPIGAAAGVLNLMRAMGPKKD